MDAKHCTKTILALDDLGKLLDILCIRLDYGVKIEQPMKFDLDRNLQIKTEVNSSLYDWAINEVDEDGHQVGTDQIPWHWSLSFTAIELLLVEEISVNEAFESQTSAFLSTPAEVTELRSISVKLRPGQPAVDEIWHTETTYRMFGTDRVIKSFELKIYPAKTENDTEKCFAWGTVSYTAELDFRDETTPDCIVFYLMVKPSTYNRYVARISEGTANEVTLTVGNVAGFYSEWSPSIETSNVKVLCSGGEHPLDPIDLPSGSKCIPPRLGSVREAVLRIHAKREQESGATIRR
ncbi:MAG: hypothetical protein AB7F96_05550 [Beijerinckiaceae bacterium]